MCESVMVRMICCSGFSMPMRQPFFPGGAAARTVSPPMMTAQWVMAAFFRVSMSWSAM